MFQHKLSIIPLKKWAWRPYCSPDQQFLATSKFEQSNLQASTLFCKKKPPKNKTKTCQWIFTISIQLKKKLQLLIWRNMNSLSPKILCVKFNENLQTCLLLEISFSMNLLLLHYYLPLALIFFFMPSIIRWENKIKRHIPCKMALLAKST